MRLDHLLSKELLYASIIYSTFETTSLTVPYTQIFEVHVVYRAYSSVG